jgi:hypothetical protein
MTRREARNAPRCERHRRVCSVCSSCNRRFSLFYRIPVCIHAMSCVCVYVCVCVCVVMISKISFILHHILLHSVHSRHRRTCELSTPTQPHKPLCGCMNPAAYHHHHHTCRHTHTHTHTHTRAHTRTHTRASHEIGVTYRNRPCSAGCCVMKSTSSTTGTPLLIIAFE